MPIAGAMSVASFSIVLAEVFASVGLSTLVPASFLQLARALRQVVKDEDLKGLSADELTSAVSEFAKFLPLSDGKDPNIASKVIQSLLSSSDTIDLLLPKTAKIKAEFSFEASESYEAGFELGAQLNVVGVRVGYSALYNERSSNKVTLEIDYVSVQEQIAGARVRT